MGKKTGTKGAHPTRKYPRREALYRRRIDNNLSVGMISRATGIHHVSYMRLEQARNDNPTRDNEPKSRFLWGGWRQAPLRLADFYFCDPEDLFPEEAKCNERRRRRAESMYDVAESLMSDYTRQSALSPEEQYEQAELQHAVRSALKRCTPNEKTVLKVMFGMMPLLGPPTFVYASLLCDVTDFGAEVLYDSGLYKMCTLPELDVFMDYASDAGRARLLRRKRYFRRTASDTTYRRRVWTRV